MDELHCRVDSKLVLFECVCETHRALRGGVESAWRNLVIQIARCNRQKPCCPNRDVHLGNRYLHFTVVKAVEFTETRSCTGATKPRKPPGTNNEPRPSPASGAVVGRSTFLGRTRRGERHHTDHQSTSHQIPGKRCESSHNHLHGRRHRRDSHRSANLVARSVPSRVGRWQRRCRRAMPRERARIGVFLCSCRPNERVLSRGACDNTRRMPKQRAAFRAACSA